MAVYDLEEQEQIDELRAWWQTHGNLITWVVVTISVAVIAWQSWNWYQNKQSAEASLIFGALQQANQMHDNSRVKNLAGELTEKYSSTTYAHLAALIAAKASIGADDTKSAQAQLQWATEHADDEIRALARIRLAGLLLDKKAFDDALKTLADEKSPAFAAQVFALKGDVYLAQSKRKEAKEAYTAALNANKDADRASAWLQLLQQKLDSLGDPA